MTTVCDVEVGQCLGRGAYSKCYAHPTDENKVILTGDFGNDMLKLTLYDELGLLDSISIDGNENHASTITKLGTEYDETHKEKIREIVRYYQSIWYDTEDKNEFLWEMGTNPQANAKMAKIANLLLNLNVSWGFDNHEGNWLVDSEGDLLPMDVFNGSGSEAESEITSRLSPKTRRVTSE